MCLDAFSRGWVGTPTHPDAVRALGCGGCDCDVTVVRPGRAHAEGKEVRDLQHREVDFAVCMPAGSCSLAVSRSISAGGRGIMMQTTKLCTRADHKHPAAAAIERSESAVEPDTAFAPRVPWTMSRCQRSLCARSRRPWACLRVYACVRIMHWLLRCARVGAE